MDAVDTLGWAAAALVVCVAAGYLFGVLVGPIRSSRQLPWLAGRALGLAAYAGLSALVGLGLWMRHPWRFRWPLLHPEVRLRVHAALASVTIVLILAHMTALAADRYAGVGWIGALVPGMAHYRTFAVALGVVSAEAMVAIGLTAGLAGRFGGGHWLPVHRLALPAFAAAWVHGVLAGTDAAALRWWYIATGVVVGAVAVSRYVASGVAPPSDESPSDGSRPHGSGLPAEPADAEPVELEPVELEPAMPTGEARSWGPGRAW